MAGLRWYGAVARVPLPIRAKQLFGSFAVAALLALVAVLGLVALGQSNSRGTELRRLQQQGGLRAASPDGRDAAQTAARLPRRHGPTAPTMRPSRSDEPDLPDFRSRLLPARVPLGSGSADRQRVRTGSASTRASGGPCIVGTRGIAAPAGQLPLSLHAVAPHCPRSPSRPFGAARCPRRSRTTVSSSSDVAGSSGTPQAPFNPVRPCRPMGGFVRGEARRPHAEDPGPRGRARRDRPALVQPLAGSPDRCRRGQPSPGSRARPAPLRLGPRTAAEDAEAAGRRSRPATSRAMWRCRTGTRSVRSPRT